jgi:DNA-binding transcriptional regulator LsrR (DeoR family)
MPRKSRSHLPPDSLSVDTTPKHLHNQEFGRRLYQHVMAKGWTQSELARRADLKRDSVSTYIRVARS